MTRILLVVLALLMSLGFARAEPLSVTDKAAVQQVITGQLQAFAVDDGGAAYGFAAPIVKFAFPTVDVFMAMVKQGYKPVYRNDGYDFGEHFVDGLGRPAQRVRIRGLDGKTYEANYSMEKQSDGTWKIAGCVLVLIPGLDA